MVNAKVLYAAPAVFPQKGRFVIKDYKRENFTETVVYYRQSSGKALNQVLLLLSLWRGFNHIKTKSGLPFVIHNHVVFPAGFFALFLSVIYRIPLLITEHWTGYANEDGRYENLSFVHHFIIRSAFRRARAVSVVSNFLKNVLAEKKLLINKPTVITPNVLNPVESVSGLPSDASNGVKALCICNLDDNQKNISGLIAAVETVVIQQPDFRITIVGSGPDRNPLEKQAEKLGLLNKQVFFTGSIPNDEVNGLYRAHHFFALNSNFETFSIATAEALMNGLPVVVTKCGGPEEFVNSANGILVEIKNTKELAKALVTMVEQYPKYSRQNIAKSILSKYSPREVSEGMRQLYAYTSA